MTRFIARVITANRITIPYEVMQILGIELGDYIEVEVLSVKKEQDVRTIAVAEKGEVKVH